MAPHYLTYIKGLIPSFEVNPNTARPPIAITRLLLDLLPVISATGPSNYVPTHPTIYLDSHAGVTTSTTLAHPAVATTLAPSPTLMGSVAPIFSPDDSLSDWLPDNLSSYLTPSSPDPLVFVFFFSLIVAAVFTLVSLAMHLGKICKRCFSAAKAKIRGRGRYERVSNGDNEEEEEQGWLEKAREKMIGRRIRWEDWERGLEGDQEELSEEDLRLVWMRR